MTHERSNPRARARGPARGGRILLAALLALGPVAPAVASPPAQDMSAASASFAEAERRLAAGDPDGAVALYEAGLERLPNAPGYEPTRARVLLTIVDAHEAAFADDGELERLRRARRLLDRYLGPLELLDEQGRAAAEDRRVGLINTITTVEARRQAEAAARAAIARRERAQAARRRGRSFTIAGAALTGLGVAGLALLGAGLGLGRATDRRIAELKAGKLAGGDDWSRPCVDDPCSAARRGELDPLLARGTAGNTLAIVGAVTGGALLATGVTLLILGRKQQREARQLGLGPTLAPRASGLGLTISGRF